MFRIKFLMLTPVLLLVPTFGFTNQSKLPSHRSNHNSRNLLVLMTVIAVLLGFPLQAKAAWYVIGNRDSDNNPIYLNDTSVYIKGNLRSAEVRDKVLGRALFVVNCQTSNYYIQTNQGRREGYAAPGTVAGIIADEVCEKYHPK